MANVMKTPTSHSKFQEFLADQVDTTRNLSRFYFESLSDAGSSDHNAGSSDHNALSDDEILDP